MRAVLGLRYCVRRLLAVWATATLLVPILVEGVGAQAPQLTWLGLLPDYDYWGVATGVSADGSAVVGYAYGTGGLYRAFRWTASGGMQDLGTLPGYVNSVAFGVSANGSVVIGAAYNTSRYARAFRWTASGGMEALDTLGGLESAAYGVSADGLVVVGWAETGFPYYYRHAFRWTDSSGMEDLGTLPGYANSTASGASADGSVVVGWAENQSRERRAFRWSAVGGMQNLGTLGGLESAAYGVSADGSVVVGFTRDRYTNPRAFRWTPARGMEDLNRIYYRLLYPGSDLVIGSAISPDGRYIVGSGYNAVTGRQEPFLLDTGFPRRGDVDRNGCVNEADLLRVLFAFGERGYRNEDIDWNGVIDDGDLLIVLFNVGNGC